MRALITGASGCLGRALVAEAEAAGWQIATTARQPADLPAFRAADLVRDPLEPLVAGCDVVLHCAALSSAWGTRAAFHDANVRATARLLEAAERAGVGRFVFASSPSIYADGTDRLNLREDAALPARQLSLYSESKLEAERLVLGWRGAMVCTAIRPRAIYGRHDRALLPRLVAAMQRGRVPMIRGGAALIDLTHRRDAARAMMLAAHGARGRGVEHHLGRGLHLSRAGRADLGAGRHHLPRGAPAAVAGARHRRHARDRGTAGGGGRARADAAGGRLAWRQPHAEHRGRGPRSGLSSRRAFCRRG
jgi:nucleoside-diphosphate-sugar epimerase